MLGSVLADGCGAVSTLLGSVLADGRPAGTMMNSMLFNASVIVLCSAACCRFCADAFDGYVAGTSTAQALNPVSG